MYCLKNVTVNRRIEFILMLLRLSYWVAKTSIVLQTTRNNMKISR